MENDDVCSNLFLSEVELDVLRKILGKIKFTQPLHIFSDLILFLEKRGCKEPMENDDVCSNLFLSEVELDVLRKILGKIKFTQPLHIFSDLILFLEKRGCKEPMENDDVCSNLFLSEVELDVLRKILGKIKFTQPLHIFSDLILFLEKRGCKEPMENDDMNNNFLSSLSIFANFLLFSYKSDIFLYYYLLKKYFYFLLYYTNNYLCLYLNFVNSLYSIIYYLYLSNLFFFKILIDITLVDNINMKLHKRFKLVYNLYSLKFNFRILLNTFINIMEPVYSIHLLYSNANWAEREIWDLFGIFFINHFDLRRILTDYGFKGFPMRKDFPVSGYIEVWYDDNIQDIIYKPLKLMQEMRFYHIISPWSYLL